MTNRLNPTFLIFGAAILFWVAGAGLSSYLSDAKHAHLATRGTVDNAENDISSATNLSMQSIEAHLKILEKKPNDTETLLAVANLCMENGMFEKAVEYYHRYLELKPDDLRTKTDYSLAILQGGKIDEAITILKEVTITAPDLFPPHLSLALAYRFAGDYEASRKEAEIGRRLAPDAKGVRLIDDFIKGLDQKGEHPIPTTAKVPDEALSPAMIVSSYFTNHPILGPKLVNITWPEVNVAKVELKEFPVDQMPPFARAKFIGSIKEVLAKLPQPVTVKIVDSETGKELLSVDF